MHLAWLIPTLPLAAFIAILFLSPRLKNNSSYVAIAAIIGAFLVTCFVAVDFFMHPGGLSRLVDWAPFGNDVIRMGFSVDSLTVMMLFVVTIVSSMVQIFSVGYMHGDKRYPRFFAYLSLFTAAMLSLVIANTLLLMYISWELVGLTSYLLIGFWFEKPEAMRAAKKAFLVTRVGDVGFFLGLLLLYVNTKSIELTTIFQKANLEKMAATPVTIPAIGAILAIILGIFAYGFAAAILKGTKRLPGSIIAGLAIFGIVFAILGVNHVTTSIAAIAALLLFWGAMGKSAQFPLHVWLPDAMEGPTPVSALIHAATMVAAGVYLVARMYPVFQIDSHALTVVAGIGAFTAVFAATIGLAMNDIKKVLAYSTISQLGYMMMALGVGGYTAGMFHLMTHAFFKANLFLGSGSVIHGTGTQDMRQMGGLRKKMPWTFATFVIGTLALAGFPGFAGFFSKDEILLAAYKWQYGPIIFYAGLAGAFMTAFYMTRLIAMTFFGKPRDPGVHAHESWKVMLVPLAILSVLSVAAGYLGWPGHSVFGYYVNPEVIGIEHMGEHPFSIIVMLAGTLAAVLGIGLASLIWMTPVIKIEKLAPAFGWVQTLVENKYYMDEMYDIVVIAPLMAINRAMFAFDRWVIDYTIVNGAGWITLQLALIWSLFDKYVVDGLVNLVGITAKIGGRVLRYVQTGIIQQYALILIACVVALGWYFVILR
jgi:NADH-quinone oxidoreductase subunit L